MADMLQQSKREYRGVQEHRTASPCSSMCFRTVGTLLQHYHVLGRCLWGTQLLPRGLLHAGRQAGMVLGMVHSWRQWCARPEWGLPHVWQQSAEHTRVSRRLSQAAGVLYLRQSRRYCKLARSSPNLWCIRARVLRRWTFLEVAAHCDTTLKATRTSRFRAPAASRS